MTFQLNVSLQRLRKNKTAVTIMMFVDKHIHLCVLSTTQVLHQSSIDLLTLGNDSSISINGRECTSKDFSRLFQFFRNKFTIFISILLSTCDMTNIKQTYLVKPMTSLFTDEWYFGFFSFVSLFKYMQEWKGWIPRWLFEWNDESFSIGYFLFNLTLKNSTYDY